MYIFTTLAKLGDNYIYNSQVYKNAGAIKH